MADVLKGLGAALLLIAVVEAAAAWPLGLRTWRAQGMLLRVNVITNPALNILLAALGYFGVYTPRSPFELPLMAAAFAVATLETVLLRAALGLPVWKAAAVSFAINAVSYLAGAFLMW
jgi:hypothetical protein